MPKIRQYEKITRLLIVTGLLIFLWTSAALAVYGAWQFYARHLAG